MKETPLPGGPPLPAPVLFGAAYYAEYQTDTKPGEDLDAMLDAGFTVIRVGESVWSTWEPENGRFDLEWLEPVLDAAHEREISVILGTPTYAVPPWLARQYPEIAGQRSTGRPIGWGARQEADFTHPAFRFHAERVVRAIVARYAPHPAVIGFQVDNEPGLELLHNAGVFARFVDHLRHVYGDVETLNREWGLVYWSHRLSTWADLWTPDGNVQPQYDVAWRQFQAAQTDEFIAWQAGLVREYAREDQFVTTCLQYDRPAVDEVGVTRALDLTAGNPYYLMQDGLARPDDARRRQSWVAAGTWALFRAGDRMFGSRQEPYLVTETNATSIGEPWNNGPAYDGQWRQVAWALVGRGARMIEYWHWHTLHFGAETFWGGVLPHSQRPGRTYRQIAALGAELRTAGPLLAGYLPDADVLMVFSNPSKWFMEKYPPLRESDGAPNGRAYHDVFDAFYRGAFDAGLQTRVVHDSQLTGADVRPEFADAAAVAAAHPLLVAAGVYAADDELLDWLAAYADAGGHLLVGPRTGYGDDLGRARFEVAPGRLADPAGAWYDEYSNVDAPVPVVTAPGSPLILPGGAAATYWIEGWNAEDATVLAGYDHPHFGRWAAVTTRRHGAGRITCVGTLPDSRFARALFDWARPAPDPWSARPEAVTHTSGRNGEGVPLHLVHNWGWEPVVVAAPVELTDPLGGRTYRAGEPIELAAWDVRLLVGDPDRAS